jgi:hypothetical protein
MLDPASVAHPIIESFRTYAVCLLVIVHAYIGVRVILRTMEKLGSRGDR